MGHVQSLYHQFWMERAMVGLVGRAQEIAVAVYKCIE